MGNSIGGVTVGEKAPDFLLRTNVGKEWRLSEQLGNVVALLFYPGNETLVCTRQLCSVRDHWQDYIDTKATIAAISPGTVEAHQTFSQRHMLPILLLADEDRSVTETYSSHWLFSTWLMRSVVVVDAHGIVRSKRSLLRAFRPSDDSVITSIYAARTDAFSERFESIAKKGSKQ